jgi:SAM-dependent methyltransferase
VLLGSEAKARRATRSLEALGASETAITHDGRDRVKNTERWQPTKFVNTARGLRASRDRREVAIGSRFIADIAAEWYERAIRAHARGRLLDMGCGYVPLFGVYRGLVQDNICIDWANTLHPSIHLDVVVDLGGNLPFEDGSFDTILLTDVLEHLAEPARAICEAARILRLGGKLIIGVPFFYWVHEAPHDYHRYTEFALQRMCQLSSLSVVELQAYGGLPEILCDLIAKALESLPRPLPVILRPLHIAASLLDATWFAKKLSERSKRVFPLGYVVVAEKLPPGAIGG